MDIEGLLNPAESLIIYNATDQEIYKAVMASWNAQEDALINSRDDDTDDNGCLLAEPCLTFKEVLAAVSIVALVAPVLNDQIVLEWIFPDFFPIFTDFFDLFFFLNAIPS